MKRRAVTLRRMTPHRMKAAQHECDGDGDAMRQTVQQIEGKHIYLGGQGKRALRFWTGTKEAERA